MQSSLNFKPSWQVSFPLGRSFLFVLKAMVTKRCSSASRHTDTSVVMIYEYGHLSSDSTAIITIAHICPTIKDTLL